MHKKYRTGAVGALLDEYERAIADLQEVIQDISDEELFEVIDAETSDKNCVSIQTILSHVVSAGFAYAVDIRQLKGGKLDYRKRVFHSTIKEYREDVNSMFSFTEDTFADIHERELEQHDNSKKIMTTWGQIYDIEQITEHAIVHILRHRRQIERFKMIAREKVK